MHEPVFPSDLWNGLSVQVSFIAVICVFCLKYSKHVGFENVLYTAKRCLVELGSRTMFLSSLSVLRMPRLFCFV